MRYRIASLACAAAFLLILVLGSSTPSERPRPVVKRDEFYIDPCRMHIDPGPVTRFAVLAYFPIAVGIWLVGLAGAKAPRWIAVTGLVTMPFVAAHHWKWMPDCPGRTAALATHYTVAAMLAVHCFERRTTSDGRL